MGELRESRDFNRKGLEYRLGIKGVFFLKYN